MLQPAYLKAIEAFPLKNAFTPKVPVHIAIQEAVDLFHWCQPDLELLVKAGLDPMLVNDLPESTAALRYIQSVWKKDFNSSEEIMLKWENMAPEALQLKKELIHHFHHAYRKHPDLLISLQRISKGNGFADMIQDLSDLSVLGRMNAEPIKEINFDFTLIDKAEQITQELSSLKAEVVAFRLKGNETKLLRNKAYAYLKQAVDEIRKQGQYVFWRNPERLVGYFSQFYRQKNKKNREKKKLA